MVLTVGVALCGRDRRVGGRATKQSRYLSYLITKDVGPASKWQESLEPSLEAPQGGREMAGQGSPKGTAVT